MDREIAKKWAESKKLVNAITLEEARARTPEQRMRILVAFLRRLAAMDRLPERGRDLEEHLAWSRVQEKWLAKSDRNT